MSQDLSGIDFGTNGEIFRKDYKMVIAMRRDLAVIAPARLAADPNGYSAGQVLAKRSDGLFGKYDNSAASGTGLDVAKGVLMADVAGDAVVNPLAQMIVSGLVFKDALVGSDASALADLGAKQIDDASGIAVIKF